MLKLNNLQQISAYLINKTIVQDSNSFIPLIN